MTRSVGLRVHGWRWPVVWWARRKPRSEFRQRVWDAVDYIDWQLVVRRRIRRSLKREASMKRLVGWFAGTRLGRRLVGRLFKGTENM